VYVRVTGKALFLFLNSFSVGNNWVQQSMLLYIELLGPYISIELQFTA